MVEYSLSFRNAMPCLPLRVTGNVGSVGSDLIPIPCGQVSSDGDFFSENNQLAMLDTAFELVIKPW